MFMHTSEDDNILGLMRFVSKSEDFQVYEALLPEKKAPAKAARSKGIDLLSKVALLKEAQLIKALKRSKRETSIIKKVAQGYSGGEANVKGDDEDVQDSDDEPQHADDERTDFDNQETNDDEEDTDDEFVHTPPNYVPTDDESNDVDEEEYDRIDKELYGDVNVRLIEAEQDDKGKEDADMIDVKHNMEQATTTTTHAIQNATTEVPSFSSSHFVSSNYTFAFLNLENLHSSKPEVVSMLNINVQHEVPHTLPLLTIPVSVIPEHTIFNPSETVTTALATKISSLLSSLFRSLQQSRPISTPTTTKATTSTTAVLDSETLTALHQRIRNFADIIKEHSVPATIIERLGQQYAPHKKSVLEDEEMMDEGVAKKLKKRKSDDADKDECPFAGSDRGLKRRGTRKGTETSKKTSATKDSSKGKSLATSSKSSRYGKSVKDQVEEPIFMQDPDYAEHDDADMPRDQGENLGKIDEQPNDEAVPKNDWYKKSNSDTSPDPEWNEGKLDRLTAEHDDADMPRDQGENLGKIDEQPNDEAVPKNDWYKKSNSDTSPDPEWNEGKLGHHSRYDLAKLLPVQILSQGRQIVTTDFFFNNDLEYLRGGSNDKKNTASTTKSKAARYELKEIEDMLPHLWILVKVVYDRYALLGISHWRTKHQNFYGYTTKMVSKHDVYSTKRIQNIISVKVNEWYGYGHLEEIVVKRADRQLYTFKEGDFKRLHPNDIEDMLLLIVQNKLNNLDGNVIVHLAASLPSVSVLRLCSSLGYGTKGARQVLIESDLALHSIRVILDNTSDICIKNLSSASTSSEGFTKVKRKKNKDKKADLQPRSRHIEGIRLNKPKPNVYLQKKGTIRNRADMDSTTKDGANAIKKVNFPSTLNSFDALNTIDVEDKGGTSSSTGNQEDEQEVILDKVRKFIVFSFGQILDEDLAGSSCFFSDIEQTRRVLVSLTFYLSSLYSFFWLEFSLVTDFACGKLVFPEYMDDGIPPFLRCVFPEKAKNLENKASLGKAAQVKAAKGKAAKGKAAKGKDAKRKAAQGKAAQPRDIGDTHSVTILDLRSLIWDDEKWKKLSVEDFIRVCLLYISEQIFMRQEDKKVVNNSFLRLVEDLAAWDDFSWGEYYWEEFYKKAVNLIDNHRDTHTNFKKKNPSKLSTYSIYGFAWAFKASLDVGIVSQQLSQVDSNLITWIRPDLKKRDENWCRKTYDYVACKETSEQVDDRNGFNRDDEPEVEQDGSGASNRASAGAKIEETKSTKEVALEEELDLWKSRYVELESYYKILEASIEIARNNSPGLSFPTPNPKATSVCDYIDEADAAADDNAKFAISVHDDVGVPDVAADDNVKTTSVSDDIDEADAAADDNAKATSVHDDVGVPDATADDNAKATSVHDDVGVPDAASDDNAKKAFKETHSGVVSAADNGEVVKETQLPDLHEDVFQPRASKRIKKETLLSDCPLVIGNYLKEIHIAGWEENLTRDSNAPKTRIHVLKEVLDYLNQAKKPRHWFPWGNGLNVDEKFWQSLVARDATSRSFLTLSISQSMSIGLFSLHITAIFQCRMTLGTGYSRTSRTLCDNHDLSRSALVSSRIASLFQQHEQPNQQQPTVAATKKPAGIRRPAEKISRNTKDSRIIEQQHPVFAAT
nr:hypothetical protein [Tanacetum cinerariifolium]